MKLVNLFTAALLWVGAPIVGYAIAPDERRYKALFVGICLLMVALLYLIRHLRIRELLQEYDRQPAPPKEDVKP